MTNRNIHSHFSRLSELMQCILDKKSTLYFFNYNKNEDSTGYTSNKLAPVGLSFLQSVLGKHILENIFSNVDSWYIKKYTFLWVVDLKNN